MCATAVHEQAVYQLQRQKYSLVVQVVGAHDDAQIGLTERDIVLLLLADSTRIISRHLNL